MKENIQRQTIYPAGYYGGRISSQTATLYRVDPEKTKIKVISHAGLPDDWKIDLTNPTTITLSSETGFKNKPFGAYLTVDVIERKE